MQAVIYPTWTVAIVRGPITNQWRTVPARLVEIIIDQIAIDRVLAGDADRITLTSTEKREAFRQAHELYASRPAMRSDEPTAAGLPTRAVAEGFGPGRRLAPWEFAQWIGLSSAAARKALDERPLNIDYRNSPIPYVLVATTKAA